MLGLPKGWADVLRREHVHVHFPNAWRSMSVEVSLRPGSSACHVGNVMGGGWWSVILPDACRGSPVCLCLCDRLCQQYTSVVAIALVCCLTGRQQRRDTTVAGELLATDFLQPKPVRAVVATLSMTLRGWRKVEEERGATKGSCSW